VSESGALDWLKNQLANLNAEFEAMARDGRLQAWALCPDPEFHRGKPMTILSGDIKLMTSQRMMDTPDGGGPDR
jgi:hypothetical protein